MFDKDKFYYKFERSHYYCEDTWYNCPAHEEAFNIHDEEDWKRECNCGADNHNKELGKALNEIGEEMSDLCNALCGVLDQSYSGMSEEDNGEYRTTYNYDAAAVDLLHKHGYVEILEGTWPQTKYLTFKFTEKRKI
jgi:hypothetical protein